MAPRKTRRSPLRWLAWLLVVSAVVAAVLWQRGTFTPEDPTASLLTAKAKRADIEETVLATGIIRPSTLVAVGAQVSGRITGVHVVIGDKVEAGELVAEIDSVTQVNDLRTAEASLAQVKAQLVERQADLGLSRQVFERQKTLSSQNATAVSELQSAEADVKVVEAQIAALEAQVDAAEVAVETAEANLDYTRITAPKAGTVLAIVNQEGQTVNAAQSAPTIVVLGDLSVMTVRAEISEADVVNVSPGQPVRFTIIGEPEKSYSSTLESIEPAPESITSDSAISSDSSSSTDTSAIYYNGIFHVENPEGRLRTYMTAEVEVILGQAQDVVTVPSTALRTTASGTNTVMVVSADKRMQERDVTVGLNDKVNAEITTGLDPDETVVIGEGATTVSSGGEMRGPPMGL
ncbi:efflux RND transporter periplasmic adaptor subunit [Roseibium sp. CAU 1637]|uniref:Efflux RND transporter periplasmic adaptor subunit n=1 Tax=Roseibium limicola TaxID=2816037 RepID=A0A939ENA4_9HYPH|nr:efflux RND transporter periplasmic adaptor subunit [Roseibium limicola]MBO0345523.1 efflux RND transporter periplasmic adaptor subunit [Roseibium limicola]